MKILYGDLLSLAKQRQFDVIVHGCNCMCVMGAGIAAQIRSQFPIAYTVDCKTVKGDRAKLGNYTAAHISQHKFTIINAYTQYDYRTSPPPVDYDAIRSVFGKIKRTYAGMRIGYPKIGAGLAGGDWSIISQIINEELKGEDHTLVEYLPAT